MRQRRTRLLALGGVAALAVLAAVLAFAAGGRAASTNICNVPSTGSPLSAASCVTELVAPHFVTPGGDAISVTKFVNQSSATATQFVIGVTFPTTNVTIRPTMGLAVDGSPADTSGCTTTTTAMPATTSVSCPAGNIPGGGTARLTVRFAVSSTMTLTLMGSVSYGEGPGNPSNPPNDYQVNYDTLSVGQAGTAGGCFDIQSGHFQIVSGGSGVQQTQVTVGPTSDSSLPCTFADAGVTPGTGLPGVTSNVSFVEFPSLSGYATVYIVFMPIPSGFNLNKSPIFEDTSGDGSFSSYITVPACDKSGDIIGPSGNPPTGQTDPSPVNDSCVFARTQLGHGNGEIGMHVLASPFDQHYNG